MLFRSVGRGVSVDSAYNVAFYAMAGLLLLGFISNLLVRPVDEHHFMSEDELEEEWQVAKSKATAQPTGFESAKASAASWFGVTIGWTGVGLPLAWGILKTVEKAATLFR